MRMVLLELMIVLLNNEGVGISSISRIVGISKSTVIRRLKSYADKLNKPIIQEDQQIYEMDELRTYVGKKSNECWIIYAINKETRKVIDFVVGRRTSENIKIVV
ncbi:MAG: hypothetical protein KBD37_05190, partial [Burkholderiales bacterium]|nr:hypothetical protein [Burkholderiales bacterium]